MYRGQRGRPGPAEQSQGANQPRHQRQQPGGGAVHLSRQLPDSTPASDPRRRVSAPGASLSQAGAVAVIMRLTRPCTSQEALTMAHALASPPTRARRCTTVIPASISTAGSGRRSRHTLRFRPWRLGYRICALRSAGGILLGQWRWPHRARSGGHLPDAAVGLVTVRAVDTPIA